MDYISPLVGVIIGLMIGSFLPSYFSKKGEDLATKEDIKNITKEIEIVKNIYKNYYDLSKAEKEFYQEMIKVVYKFLAEIKKYELSEGKSSVTKEKIMSFPAFEEKYYEFMDSANEILGKAFVFLKEENYVLLKNSINPNMSFNELTKNLLYAMRKSLYPGTKLNPETDLRELQY